MMQSVEIVEVGPRDGLQNEQAIITTDDKVALINKAIAAGSRRIEVASFVHPGRGRKWPMQKMCLRGCPIMMM